MRLVRLFAHVRLLAVLIALASAGGCASRQDQIETAGSPDQRRQEIARLDQQIAQAETELGFRRAASPPPSAGDGEPAMSGEEVGGGERGGSTDQIAPSAMPEQPSPRPMAPSQEPPPSRQSAVTQSRFAQPPASGGSCARVCRSVAAICDASGRICRLAEDLDDAWASGRCQAANRSCANAQQRAESSCGECD